jgi:hypothetical protein
VNGLDDRAIDLCSDYQHEGSAAFVIRTLESGDCRVIGLQLPASMVAQMLRAAADMYEQNMPEGPFN